MNRVRPLLAGSVGCVLVALGQGAAARAEAPRCNRWNIEVACTTDVPRMILTDTFEAKVIAKNSGDTTLDNVTIRLRGDQGAPCVSGPGTGVSILVEHLAPGESKELTAKFKPESLGLARVLGSARDSLGWASGNCACTVEVIGLPAIQADMSDKDLNGVEKGVFRLNEEFLYVLFVENDVGTEVTPDLKVVFTLPKELEFVSGSGDQGITVTGAGQSATSSAFVLAPPNQKVKLTVRVKVLALPPSTLVKVLASIQTTGGVPLASETESTTVQ